LWAEVFWEVIGLQVKKLEDHPDSFLTRYVINMYRFQMALTKEELNVYQALKLADEFGDREQEGAPEDSIELGDEENEEKDEVETRSAWRGPIKHSFQIW
jgi:hypothetical protein